MGMGITLKITNLIQRLTGDRKRGEPASLVGENATQTLETGAVASHPAEPLVVICNRAEGSLSLMTVTESGEIQETHRLEAGSNPTMAGWSPDGHRLFVLNAGLGISVWRRCLNKGLRKVGFFLTGSDCVDFVISRDEFVYVAQSSNERVAIFEIEGGRLTARGYVPCVGEPESLALNSDGTVLKATCSSKKQAVCFEIGAQGELHNPSILTPA